MSSSAVFFHDPHDVRGHIRCWVRQVLINGHLDDPLDVGSDLSSLEGFLEENPGITLTCTAEAYRGLVISEMERQRLYFERSFNAIKSSLLEVPA